MAPKAELLPPNPSRLIEGLRDTGYDFNTALADIIDNSVDAGASQIQIRIMMDTDGDIQVSVADDGCGMDRRALLNGMTYGANGEHDPRRLGKFGLGLKTASTAFCRRLSVITRPSGDAKALKATWDLDHVVKASEWELLFDEPRSDELAILDATAADASGTLVIWDKVDRLLKDYAKPTGSAAKKGLQKIIDGFRDHASMIYQRFLDHKDERARNIEMKLNGITVRSWNPFCEDEEMTECVAETVQDVELPDGSTAKFTLRAFVIPRREQFSSEAAARHARLGNAMQGIYIYRENRLIHPADWLGMYSKEPHGTLLRVEFSFDHALDAAFQVDIKKSRILLNEDLHAFVKDQFLPAPRNAADTRYRTGQRTKANAKAKNAHDESNRAIGSKEKDLSISKIMVTDPEKNEVQVTNKSGMVKLRLQLGKPTHSGQIHIQTVEEIQDGMLWRPALIEGHHAAQINTGHPYYHKVYVPNHNSGVTMQGLDSLLWALVEAELGTVNESTKSHFEELRFEVSRLLRKLVEDMPEPKFEEESDD